MKVMIFTTDINLIDRYNTLLLYSHYELITNYDELIIEAQKENIVILMNIDDCETDIESCLTPLIELNAYIMILDPVPNYEKGKKLISLGVRGYGNLMMDDNHLIAAINTVSDGDIWLYPEFINETIRRMNFQTNPKTIDNKLEILSQREKEVALLVIEKLTYVEIAQKLDITLRTVKAHTKNIYDKFSVKNRLSFLLLFIL